MSTRTVTTHAAREKRGVVLVLFVLLVIGFMALAGIAIDLGLARMAQRQMQSAADSVAVETLRERDRARIDPAATDPFLRDLMRRSLNSRYATWRYTDDLVGDGGETEESRGAGGYILLSEGQGSLNWGRQVTEVGWSAPRLAPNYETEAGQPGGPVTAIPRNKVNGDMVSGAFDAVVANPQGNPFRMEVPSYERFDFTPAESDESPYASSMLVRLRRTAHDSAGGSGGLDDELGISTNGPTVPMLFSAGTAIQGGDSETNDSIRHTGFRVRATSIATARRAVRAGVRVEESVIQEMIDSGSVNAREAALMRVGVAPLVMDAFFWQSEPGVGFEFWTELEDGSQAMVLEIHATSDDTLQNTLGVIDPASGNSQGEFPAGSLVPPTPRQVGDRLPWPPPDAIDHTAPGFWLTDEALIPIYLRRVTFTPENGFQYLYWVIGFGRVRTEIWLDEDGEPRVHPDTGYFYIRLIRFPNEANTEQWIAPRNASARFDGNQNPDLTKAQWDDLLQRWSTLPATRLVHAPALAR